MSNKKVTKVEFKHDTFWNQQRVQQDLRLVDVAEYMHKNHTTVCRWFTGCDMPTDDQIHQLCELFGIDYLQGKQEFIKAHDQWVSIHEEPKGVKGHKIEVAVNSVTTPPKPKKVESNLVDLAQAEPIHTETLVPKSTLLELVYGKIPYDAFFKFTTLVANKTGNPIKLIYGKVTYEEYEAIRKMLDGIFPESFEIFEDKTNEEVNLT